MQRTASGDVWEGEPVRYVVFGAGAIGGVVGGRLAEAGEDVTLIARGAHAEAIRRDGLTVESPDRRVTLSLPVVTDARQLAITEQDAVLLAVKSQDTWTALDVLRAAAPPATPIVCLQNGVENERVALRLFPNVYGVCVMCPAAHLEPGVVQAYSSPVTGMLDVGRYPGGVDDVAHTLAASFSAATFPSQARPDVLRWKYTKLLLNLMNAIEALAGPTGADSELARRAREEGVACLRAAGIDFASEEEDRQRRGDLLRLRPIGGARRGGGSSWQSLERRTGSIETDYLNGEIVLLGRRHGVPTPVNDTLQRLAARAAATGARPGAWTEEEILAEAGSA